MLYFIPVSLGQQPFRAQPGAAAAEDIVTFQIVNKVVLVDPARGHQADIGVKGAEKPDRLDAPELGCGEKFEILQAFFPGLLNFAWSADSRKENDAAHSTVGRQPRCKSWADDSFGTGRISDEAITDAVLQVFSFKPAAIVKQLNLLRPIYLRTTNYGHFGKVKDPKITWEKTDKVSALRKAAR